MKLASVHPPSEGEWGHLSCVLRKVSAAPENIQSRSNVAGRSGWLPFGWIENAIASGHS